jgi:hypothetical protein
VVLEAVVAVYQETQMTLLFNPYSNFGEQKVELGLSTSI